MGERQTSGMTLELGLGVSRSGVVPLLCLLLSMTAFAALMTGPFAMTAGETVKGLLGSGDAQQTIVIWHIRMPRIGAAVLTGVALAVAGASYQSLFRNPLVSPDILGVSAGAGLGAVIGIFLSLPIFAIQLAAFLGGLLCVGMVMLIAASVRQADRILALVLTGVVVGALGGAATSLLKVLADPYDQLPAITFWLLGSLASVTSADLIPALPVVTIGLLPLILLRWQINVLSLGEEEAKALGVSTATVRLTVIAAATLITASVTAIAGVIGWVGLVIPHIARMIVGPVFGRLLAVSGLLGGLYLLTVDTLARTLSNVEIPLGILTATIGAPFFIWLLASGRRGWT